MLFQILRIFVNIVSNFVVYEKNWTLPQTPSWKLLFHIVLNLFYIAPQKETQEKQTEISEVGSSFPSPHISLEK